MKEPSLKFWNLLFYAKTSVWFYLQTLLVAKESGFGVASDTPKLLRNGLDVVDIFHLVLFLKWIRGYLNECILNTEINGEAM